MTISKHFLKIYTFSIPVRTPEPTYEWKYHISDFVIFPFSVQHCLLSHATQCREHCCYLLFAGYFGCQIPTALGGSAVLQAPLQSCPECPENQQVEKAKGSSLLTLPHQTKGVHSAKLHGNNFVASILTILCEWPSEVEKAHRNS